MTPSSLTYNEAMADVRARVKAAQTSFASGMGVLPIPRREAMYALYAFCREVDDIADDSPTAAIRESGLNLWRERIHDLFQNGQATDSITVALKPAVTLFTLAEEDFQGIIEGMEMDARETICAPSMEKLDLYCDHVASAVGRASVRIFGDPSTKGMKVAYHLGRALQLTNILRDLAEDAQRGRLYLPEECLAQAGIASREPLVVLADPALPVACRALAQEATRHFEEADIALKRALWYPMRPARAMRRYYGAILVRLLKADWKNPAQRISLPLWEKILIALRGLIE